MISSWALATRASASSSKVVDSALASRPLTVESRRDCSAVVPAGGRDAGRISPERSGSRWSRQSVRSPSASPGTSAARRRERHARLRTISAQPWSSRAPISSVTSSSIHPPASTAASCRATRSVSASPTRWSGRPLIREARAAAAAWASSAGTGMLRTRLSRRHVAESWSSAKARASGGISPKTPLAPAALACPGPCGRSPRGGVGAVRPLARARCLAARRCLLLTPTEVPLSRAGLVPAARDLPTMPRRHSLRGRAAQPQ